MSAKRLPILPCRPLAAALLIALTTAASFGEPTPGAAANPSPTTRPTFRNPIKLAGADPWMTWFNGNYFLATTTGHDVELRRAPTMNALKDAKDVQVWTDQTPERSKAMWASEFHHLDAGDGRGMRWFCYYTASDGKEDGNHRLYVLESAGDDPMGPYTFKAKLKTDPDDKQYAIDGTVFRNDADGQLYLVFCGRPSVTGQGLFISKLSNPWTTVGPRTAILASGFGEHVPVREGPEILQHEGKIDLIYSSSPADTPDYKLGLMIADAKADLLNPASWHQHPKPVFTRSDKDGVYGPGHNFFFKSPDGTEDWIVYHAKSGVAATYRDRSTRAQPFTWGADGIPNFGTPLPLTADVPVPSGEK